MLDFPNLVSTMQMSSTLCKRFPPAHTLLTVDRICEAIVQVSLQIATARWEPIYDARRDLNPSDKEMSKLIIQLWTSFIKTGVPTR